MPRSSSAAKVQEWVERLERLQSSGLTAAKFCQAEGISPPSFYQWKRKLTAPANLVQEANRGPSAFTAIKVRPGASSMTTIRLPGGVSIEFSGNPRMLELWLQKLLEQALKSGSSPC
jgi:hypothetical protein